MEIKRSSIILIALSFCLITVACNEPTKSSPLVFPSPPDWLDVYVSFDRLPAENIPAQLSFEITVTGEDSSLPVTDAGDTLDLLYMKFYASDWVVGLHDDADTLWEGKVEVGRRIVLDPIFQIDTTLIPAPMLWINDSTLIPIDPDTMHYAYSPDGDTTRHFWSSIALRAMFYGTGFPTVHDADSLWENNLFRKGYTLFFDHRTGDYTFSD